MSLSIMLLWTVTTFTLEAKGVEWVPIRVRGEGHSFLLTVGCAQAWACLCTGAHCVTLDLLLVMVASPPCLNCDRGSAMFGHNCGRSFAAFAGHMH